VDLIACEDTRQTAKLLRNYSITTSATSFHEHNEDQKALALVKHLEAGDNLALVSDAGTPLISDPGFGLVKMCRELGISVVPVPGPSAVLAALSVSGLPCHRFLFVGFPSAKATARRKQLESLAKAAATLVFYLSPHRLVRTMEDMLEVLGNRQAFLIREMTKIHETSYSGLIAEVLDEVRSEKARGEYVLVVEGSQSDAGRKIVDLAAYVSGLQQVHGLSRKDAIRRTARELDLPRREVYQLVVVGGKGTADR
jgi:16S rRNA (cytidine1402-2'-O)-methyltransferase